MYDKFRDFVKPKEEAKTGDDTDLPLFIDTRGDAIRLLEMTEE